MTVIPDVLRTALRSTLRSRRTALTILVTLTFGISVSVTIFAVVNAILFRPLPFESAERLVVIGEYTQETGDTSVAWPNFLDWQESASTLEAMAAVKMDRFAVRLRRGADEIPTCLITHDLLPMLGVRPLMGSGFTPADDQSGAGQRALLSWGLWQREFAGDERVVGQGILIEGRPFTIAGVMPRGFQIPLATEAEIWVPFGPFIESQNLLDRGAHAGIDVLGRRKAGVALATVRADMNRIAAALAATYPDTNRGLGARVEDLRERVVAGIRPVLLILLAGAILVLLIACTNAATLLLARVTARQHDFAVKMSIGATPLAIVLEVMAEIVVLSAASAAAACLVAFAALRQLQRFAPDLPRITTASLDARVFLFATATVVVAASIAGLPSAVRVIRQPLTVTLKQIPTDTGSGRRRGAPARGLMIGLQFAFTATLLVITVLLVLSFARVRRADLGFSPESVLAMPMPIPANRYPQRDDRLRFLDQLVARLEQHRIPAAICSPMPLTGTTWTSAFTREGALPGAATTEVELYAVSPAFFRLMEIQLRQGRTFAESDRLVAQRMVVVDELFARSQWPNSNPIGKRIQLSSAPAASMPWLEVVGVVRHIESQGLGTPVRVQAYLPYWNNVPRRPSVIVPNTPVLGATVTSIVRRLDPEVPIGTARSLASYQDTLLLSRRLASVVLYLFAAASVALAGFGLYGLVSYTIALRRREIGIRLALGASPREVWTLVTRQLLQIAVAGVLIGLAAAYGFAPRLAPLLYETPPHELRAYVTIALALLAFAAPIALLPARRATIVPPQSLLKD